MAVQQGSLTLAVLLRTAPMRCSMVRGGMYICSSLVAHSAYRGMRSLGYSVNILLCLDHCILAASKA